MALAMAARAYGLKDRRTSIYELVYNPRDTWFLLIGSGFTLTTICYKKGTRFLSLVSTNPHLFSCQFAVEA